MATAGTPPRGTKAGSSNKPQPITITALDGFLLSGTLHLPPQPIVTTQSTQHPGPKNNSDLSSSATHKTEVEALTKVVIISSATATIQDFYYKFSNYLSQELGMIVITYDNRGVGRSMPGSQQQQLSFLKAEQQRGSLPVGNATAPALPPKSNAHLAAQAQPEKPGAGKETKEKNPLIGFEATIVDWSMQDLPGVFNFVLERFPHNPTLFVGHSVGGHILPAIDSYYTRNLERCLYISVTSAYWRNMNSPLFTYWFFYMASPVVNARYGFYPGKTLWKSMEDLPKGCFETWSYWGSFKEYMLGGNPEWKPAFDRFKVPVYSLYFSDDDFSSTSAPKIMDSMPNAMRRCVGLDPIKDLNMKKVGHMGFFFNSCKEKLWKTAVHSWFMNGQALDRKQIKELAMAASSYARL
ncbi:hypothetical protein EMPS_03464 [Entomortierella parvispora]|uniref:AB hydrolase-1 domain-containing protein n=1 Tax=Entomortierella parvispora TaxID=205924 RepID=A0A9P3H6L9_9FUNG|nr:hypothetical protein EMPS_03464 [Entomortierella parvispora]